MTNRNPVLIVLLTMPNFHTLQRHYGKDKMQPIQMRKQYHSNPVSYDTVHFLTQGGFVTAFVQMTYRMKQQQTPEKNHFVMLCIYLSLANISMYTFYEWYLPPQ